MKTLMEQGGEPRSAQGGGGSTVGTTLAHALLTLIGGLFGFAAANFLVSRSLLSGPNNLLYLTIVGLLLGYLVSGRLARRFGSVWSRALTRVASIPPDAVLAAFAGATLGLLITVLLNNLLADVPGFTWYWSQLIALVLVTGMGGFFVSNRRLFPFLRAAPATDASSRAARSTDKVIDTSAIIDGRFVSVAEANFLEGRLLIPHYVLTELQRISDSGDQVRRQRGRRGLEALDQLLAQGEFAAEVVHDGDTGSGPVDDRLVRLCIKRRAALVTTDYNLAKVAELQGVRVLNMHQLASAVKATYLPGERLSLSIVRQGREAGQGLAYLEDGTMVVVEEAGDNVGETIEVVVTSSLQTNMGRMIFAKPAPDNSP